MRCGGPSCATFCLDNRHSSSSGSRLGIHEVRRVLPLCGEASHRRITHHDVNRGLKAPARNTQAPGRSFGTDAVGTAEGRRCPAGGKGRRRARGRGSSLLEDVLLHVGHVVLLADGLDQRRRLLVRQYREVGPEVVLYLRDARTAGDRVTVRHTSVSLTTRLGGGGAARQGLQLDGWPGGHPTATGAVATGACGCITRQLSRLHTLTSNPLHCALGS